ncbi:hypothetical protein Lal_00003721 [Lupinus albus]|uniref:Uncharacterized protein n=1 Tax=Lupinus albus TaxID=3870 RepID=A0A6A4Q334_LUPAL|nr:hypothetical protein Lalb_Chr08g0230921 [Lupinus albus]KAF1870515.1 hypothetical protein Lal_00003721 [Lupinus albus]
MAYQNSKIYGWCPNKDYQVHEVTQPALHKHLDRPHHNKGHVSFKTNNNNEDHVAQVKVEDSNYTVSVDQLADSFIKHEHRRIELARLISMKGAI